MRLRARSSIFDIGKEYRAGDIFACPDAEGERLLRLGAAEKMEEPEADILGKTVSMEKARERKRR